MKKLLAIVLCIVLFAGTLPVYAAQQAEIDPAYEEAVQFLIDLGLMNSVEDINAPADRGSLAQIAVMARGGQQQSPMDTPFDDVKADDPRSGYILSAYQTGLMKGYSDIKFDPYGYITSTQVTIVMTRLIGYDAIADYHGGDYAAYMSAAAKAGILKGVTFDNPDAVTVGELAYAVRNTLDADIMEISGVSNDESMFTVAKGTNLLNSVLDLTLVEGQVTSNYYTGLASASNLDENEIEISRKVYISSKDNAADYLGMQVKAYIDDTNRIRAIERADYDDKTELTVSSYDVVKITDGTITYTDESGKNRDADYLTNGYLIYNGMAKVNWGVEDLKKVTNGTIRLLSSDNGGKYDIIFADEYIDLIVNSVSAEDETVYFKSGSVPAKLDFSTKGNLKYLITDASGNEMELTGITKGSMLSAAISLDGTVAKLVAGVDTVVGTCASLSDNYITIDDTEYELTSKLYGSSAVKVGTKGEFYINHLGKVAYVDSDVRYKYGFLRDIGIGNGLDSTVSFEIFTEDGELKIFTLKDKVKMINSGDSIKASDIKSNTGLFDGEEPKPQLIAYNANADDFITEFDVAKTGGALMDYTEKQEFFTLEAAFVGDTNRATRYIGKNWKMFAGRYLLDDDTKVFLIPTDLDEDKKFSIIGHGGLVNETFYGNVKIYDESESNKVKVVVIPADGVTSIDKSSPVGIVKRIKTMMNSEGEESEAITVVTGGKEVTLYSDDNEAICDMENVITNKTKDPYYKEENSEIFKIKLSALDEGDIICYNAGADGEIRGLEVMLRVKYADSYELWADTTSRPVADYYYMQRYSAYGIVDANIETGIRMLVSASTGSEIYTRVVPFNSSTNIIRFGQKGEVKSISAGDIAPGDKIYIYAGEASGIALAVVYEQ
ncbi:MAG: S-layer homology domain-containing protein [Clostridia bacterium]|nr:S-layer homology domain-containing protein [Clostridia bacterium]